MHYLITDGHGYLAGQKLHRHPQDKSRVVSLWSSKRRDAMRLHFYEAAEYMLRKIGNPEARIIQAGR